MTVCKGEIVEWMERTGDPAYATVEIAEQFDIDPETALGHLTDLSESGDVLRKKPGTRTIIWWPKSHENHDWFSQ